MDIIKKFNVILDKKQKTKIAGLSLMILLGGILETLGVSMILPLLYAILDKAAFMENKYVQIASNMIRIYDADTFIFLLVILLVIIFIGKGAYILFLTYLQAKFVNNNRCIVSKNMLLKYLHKPYEYYLNTDSATILRTIYGDMDNIFNLLMQCLNLLVEVIVSLCLMALLLIMDWKMMLMFAALLGGATLFIIKFLKPRAGKVGENSRAEMSRLYKWVLQSASGIKDIKVLNRESYFADQYGKSAKAYASHQVKNNVFVALPRLLIETVAIVGILIYVAIQLLTGSDVSKILPLISAFGVAAIRLMPSVNRINTYIANIAYFEPALNYIYENVDLEDISYDAAEVLPEGDEKKKAAMLTLQKGIALKGITYRYPNTDKKIFNQADMLVPTGKSVGIVGTSGAGKSTIVDVLLGLLQMQEGHIYADGKDVFESYEEWLSYIGYIPQTIYMLDDTIRNNVAFGVNAEDINEVRIWEVLEEAQLKEFVEQLEEGLDTEIGERGVRMSGGQRQRLGIARALYHNPKILVFDEATSALDNDTETAIMEAIDRLHGQKTMIIIAHRLRTIENCDIIYEVVNGKILQKESV